MKILIIGGTGTIGEVVAAHFMDSDHILVGSRNHPELPVDITDTDSIQAILEKTAPVDALVCIAGEAKWAPLRDMSEADFHIGIQSKLMGQVNLARIGMDYLVPGGSITLSTGILADDPVLHTTSAAMVNGAIHSFVKAAALEMEQGCRINAVSLGVVEAAYEKYKAYFPGHPPIEMEEVARAYERAVKGRDNGRIIRVYH
jgi:NAD(P)-dependent dehydrogenase (short-subunit alcohol dehydrogenase family)